MTVFAPHRALCDRVDHYGFGRHGTDAAGFRFEYYPDGSADLLFELTPERCKLLFFGPARQRASIVLHSECAYFSVRFRPGGFPRSRLLDPAALVDGCEALDRLFGVGVDELGEALWTAPTATDRKAIVDGLLLAGVLGEAEPRGGADATIAWIEASRGMAPIRTLAQQRNLSMRQIQRHTREWVGLTPKTLARNLRLQWVLMALDHDPAARLTTLAHAAGYNDQPHFIRDFKALTGRTPTNLLRQERIGFRMVRLKGSTESDAAATVRHAV